MTSRKEMMRAALLDAQQHIAAALAALTTADDDGFSPIKGMVLAGQDAQIHARAAYHALRNVAYPESTDPLDAILDRP